MEKLRRMSGLIIRFASMSDLSAICDIEDDSFPFPYPRSLLQRLLQRYGETFLVAVGENEELVGYCVSVNEGVSAHLISIAVRRDFRRRGYATALLDEVLANAGGNGISELWLEVGENNAEALSLYSKMGFERSEVITDYYPDGSDAIRMRLIVGQVDGNVNESKGD